MAQKPSIQDEAVTKADMSMQQKGVPARVQAKRRVGRTVRRTPLLRDGSLSPSATVVATASAAGVAPHVVRYYTRIGLLKPRRDPHNGYKLFDADDIKRLRFVCQAQGLGFTLAEIRKILRDADRRETPCPRVRDMVRRRIEENRREISTRQALQRRLEDAIEAWARMPDGIPDGDSVCHLIKSVGEKRI